MIIVSQDKKKVVNFDNCMLISIERHAGEVRELYAWLTEKFYPCLGRYPTDERAKEVLQEIVDMCVMGNRYRGAMADCAPVPPKVFYMPKE